MSDYISSKKQLYNNRRQTKSIDAKEHYELELIYNPVLGYIQNKNVH
jgi:hypothetical protein